MADNGDDMINNIRNAVILAIAFGAMYVPAAPAQPVPGPREMTQQIIPWGQMPDGSWRHIVATAYTETREGTDQNGMGYDQVVQAVSFHAYERVSPAGLGEVGPLDPDNSWVSFSVNGQCPHPGLPAMTCQLPGDYTQFGMDERGRYYATACDMRSESGACAISGANFFFGVSANDIDALEAPPLSAFTVLNVAPWCRPHDCPPHLGFWTFSTSPSVEVLSAVVEVRHLHPVSGPGPVVQVEQAPRHAHDITLGWYAAGSDNWTFAGTWCEIVPGVVPDGGDYQYRFVVTALDPIDGVPTSETSLWKDMFVASCDWVPNPADLNRDGSANIFDLAIFRRWFGQ